MLSICKCNVLPERARREHELSENSLENTRLCIAREAQSVEKKIAEDESGSIGGSAGPVRASCVPTGAPSTTIPLSAAGLSATQMSGPIAARPSGAGPPLAREPEVPLSLPWSLGSSSDSDPVPEPLLSSSSRLRVLLSRALC